jgi:hypothetical protein
MGRSPEELLREFFGPSEALHREFFGPPVELLEDTGGSTCLYGNCFLSHMSVGLIDRSMKNLVSILGEPPWDYRYCIVCD